MIHFSHKLQIYSH